jgi:predicted acyltransferase
MGLKNLMDTAKKIARQHLKGSEIKKPTRILSIDALRGFDMIWILGAEGIFAALFVITGWPWLESLALQMQHSIWHGVTAYDLIFPLFIFLAGVSLGISAKPISQYSLEQRKPLLLSSIKRLVLLISLGVLYNHGWGVGVPMQLEDVRFASVLGRIGIAWFVAAMLCWYVREKMQWLIAGSILLGYWGLLAFVEISGFGGGNYTTNGAINVWFDAKLLPGTSYQGLAIDPEGVLSNISSIVNALAGVFIGRLMIANVAKPLRLISLLLMSAAICLALGNTWHLIFPINKTLWTSSFVLVSVGYSLLLLVIFYYLFDVLKLTQLAKLFAVIGCNSIIIYLASSIVNWQYINSSLFGGFLVFFNNGWSTLISIVTTVFLQWLLLYWLYQRKIFIKV